MKKAAAPFKYKEDEILKDIETYLLKTYGMHYTSPEGIQAFDIIKATGHAMGFCMGSINKYAFRYGRKNGFNRDDLMKIVHYAILALYLHDQETET